MKVLAAVAFCLSLQASQFILAFSISDEEIDAKWAALLENAGYKWQDDGKIHSEDENNQHDKINPEGKDACKLTEGPYLNFCQSLQEMDFGNGHSGPEENIYQYAAFSQVADHSNDGGSVSGGDENNQGDDVHSKGFNYLDQNKCGHQSLNGQSEEMNERRGPGQNKTFSERIFGGIKARRGQYPWMARLLYKKGENVFSACGGVLISRSHVLSAAHCDDNTLKYVLLGYGTTAQTIPIMKIVNHEQYDKGSSEHDVSLLKLGEDAKFNDFVAPVCLPMGELASETFEGKTGIVTGYGKTESKEESDDLLVVYLPIISNKDCRHVGRDFTNVQAFQMCAGGEKGKDACQGDSGGPMIVLESNTNQYVVVGLVSYGYGCAREGMPGIYTRVTYYLPWIIENMK